MTGGAVLPDGAPFVKICGITRLEDAEAAIAAGADAIGLNFVPASKRRIGEDAARAIASAVAGRVAVIGVVADLPLAELARLRGAVGIDWVQLHGQEGPGEVGAALPAAFKAALVGDASDAGRAAEYPGDFLLVDTKVDGAAGGTGKTFDWSLVRGLARARRLIVAGGLTPANVGDAVRAIRPFGVDVASGVESAPGVKDPAKVRAFVAAARNAL